MTPMSLMYMLEKKEEQKKTNSKGIEKLLPLFVTSSPLIALCPEFYYLNGKRKKEANFDGV